MKATIHDVARKAGVSTRTVSRVINQQGEISAETRARVQGVIVELNYRPNILARSLVSRRSQMLGVVAWGLDYYAPSRIVVGIEQRASELGYSLFLNLLSHPTAAGAERILDTLAAHRVEGILWAVPQVADNRAWIESARMEDIPPVVFLTTQPRPELASISVDNRLGGFLATEHLLRQGRRRIGLISGPSGWWESQERAAGWGVALSQAGMAAEPGWTVEADWSVEGGVNAMQALLERGGGLDAVFASSDDIALGALAALNRAGLRVPQDVALVGFDNIPQSGYYQPALTTIHQPLAQVGRKAVDLLHARISGRDASAETGSLLEPPRLIVRASSSLLE